MYTAPFAEHAPNGNGTTFALVWFGGKMRNPAAVTGLHWDGRKLRTFTIWNSAVAVSPWFSVTWCAGPPVNAARWPSKLPVRLTALMNGKPFSVQACPDRLVSFRL